MARARAEDGQATVELVAVLPVFGLVALLAWQALVAGQSWWLAAVAARDAARAQALGEEARGSAKTLSDGSVRVRLGSAIVRARMEPQS